MWKRGLVALALLGPAAPAWAFGLGTTVGFGPGTGAFFDVGTGAVSGTANGFLPSFDLHFGNVAVQIHVLELLGALGGSDFFAGANAYFGIPVGSVGNWDAMIAPGLGLDLGAEPFEIAITAESQFGLVHPDSTSVGIFLVPALGFWSNDADSGLLVGGTLQLSIWWAVGGKG